MIGGRCASSEWAWQACEKRWNSENRDWVRLEGNFKLEIFKAIPLHSQWVIESFCTVELIIAAWPRIITIVIDTTAFNGNVLVIINETIIWWHISAWEFVRFLAISRVPLRAASRVPVDDRVGRGGCTVAFDIAGSFNNQFVHFASQGL